LRARKLRRDDGPAPSVVHMHAELRTGNRADVLAHHA